MTKKLERCVKDVSKTGKSKSSSYAICTASLKRENILKVVKKHHKLITISVHNT